MAERIKLCINKTIFIKIPHLKKCLQITANDTDFEIICLSNEDEYKVLCESCDFEEFEKYIAFKQLVELCNTMKIKDKELESFNSVIDEMFYKMYGYSYDEFYNKVIVETNFLVEKC